MILVLNALTPRAAFRASARRGMKAMDMQASVRTSMNVKMGRMTAMQTQNAMIQMEVTIASVTSDSKEAGTMAIAPMLMSAKEVITTVTQMQTVLMYRVLSNVSASQVSMEMALGAIVTM